jgi:hypothetical protein
VVVTTYVKTQSLTWVDYILSICIYVGHCDFSLCDSFVCLFKFYRIWTEWQVETNVYIMFTLLTHKYCSYSQNNSISKFQGVRGSTVEPVMENNCVLYTVNLLVIYKPCHMAKRSQHLSLILKKYHPLYKVIYSLLMWTYTKWEGSVMSRHPLAKTK